MNMEQKQRGRSLVVPGCRGPGSTGSQLATRELVSAGSERALRHDCDTSRSWHTTGPESGPCPFQPLPDDGAYESDTTGRQRSDITLGFHSPVALPFTCRNAATPRLRDRFMLT